jgi:hypothetical protein
MSSSEFVILRPLIIAKSNSLSGHFFPYGQRSPVSYPEPRSCRRLADVAAARRRARRLPTAADFAPTAADLLGWRPPHMSGANLRRTVAKCAEVHAPKRRRI